MKQTEVYAWTEHKKTQKSWKTLTKLRWEVVMSPDGYVGYQAIEENHKDGP